MATIVLPGAQNSDCAKCARPVTVSGKSVDHKRYRELVNLVSIYSYYGVIIPSVFNLCSMTGFCILNCILGGQTLASISNGHLSWRYVSTSYACSVLSNTSYSVGIVVITLISLFVSFCGYRVLNWYVPLLVQETTNTEYSCCRYERLAWLPVLVVYLVALGVGGKHLSNPPPAEPATAAAVLSFASTIAGFVITYCALGSDFTIYFSPSVQRYAQLNSVSALRCSYIRQLENIPLLVHGLQHPHREYRPFYHNYHA